MALQPSKNKSKTSIKKKATRKKSTVKPKKSKGKKKTHTKRNIFIVLAVFLMFVFIVLGYYLGKNSDAISALVKSGEIKGEYRTKTLVEDLSKLKIDKLAKKHIVVKTKPKIEDKVKKTLIKSSGKAKLVIIIDDVSKKSQINAMKATGLKMTAAIFPPSELSMTSHHLARGLKHAMIHLPMESSNTQFNTHYKTLFTHFTNTQIEARVRELRRLFPNIRYVNNHTGSVFTGNESAMKKLYRALRKEGFIFIDSRTVGNSKVGKIAGTFGDMYISRDIFIDNVQDISYIHNQLKKAVKIAKKRGYAIAIGHPYKVTMKALGTANEILKDVELVYVDEIMKRK